MISDSVWFAFMSTSILFQNLSGGAPVSIMPRKNVPVSSFLPMRIFDFARAVSLSWWGRGKKDMEGRAKSEAANSVSIKKGTEYNQLPLSGFRLMSVEVPAEGVLRSTSSTPYTHITVTENVKKQHTTT
jgi:hypothetical protein